MNNQALHDFIKTKLQDETTEYVFGGESYWSYFNGGLTFNVSNQTTLRIDKKEIIPFTIASYESERQPLDTIDIRKYTLPIVFSIKYDKKDEWIPLIESFSDKINGKQFTIDSETVAFGVTGVSQNGNSAELNADDWFQVTLTVYGYSGDVYKGNGMTYTFNGVEIEPLSYSSTMEKDTQQNTAGNDLISKSKANSKTRTKGLVLYYKIGDADTIIEEIEGETLSSTYSFVVAYPSGKSYTSTVLIQRGTSTIVNGDGIIFEMVMTDAKT